MNNLVDLTFGRLTVTSKAGRGKDRHLLWNCSCACGGTTIASGRDLRRGHTQSCGCYARERQSECNLVHGQKVHYKITRIFRTYNHMKERCSNPKAHGYWSYGGKGIRVCIEWLDSFQSFASWAYENGYNDALSIDRINPNGDYSPENCRWVTQHEQSRNTTRNIFSEIDGERLVLTDIAKRVGVSKSCLYYRYYKQGLRGQELIKGRR